MNHPGTHYSLETFRGDFFGGLTSMVVMLPIALGFGIASGMGAAAGLYGAIVTGFFAAVFGGTRTQISGPTAPMTVAMVVVITSHASNLAEALAIVVLAGFLQILLGLSRIGRFVAYTPQIVISGFMSGIGLIVVLLQLLPLFGAAAVSDGAIGAVMALPDALANVDTGALVIGVVTIATGFAWPRRLYRYAPGPLVALAAGTLLGVFWFTEAPAIGSIPTGLPSLRFAFPHVEFLTGVIEPAIILALLGSVESLLSSLIADSLTGNRHNPDRELIGQGIGNMTAGLIGALPGTGSVIGTVTNTRSGATTRVAGMICALLLLILVVGLGELAEPIPLAALAGVLIKVGWDTIDWQLIVRIHLLRREYLVVFLTTLLLTVFIDLISAVAIGLIAAGWVHARRLEKLELDSVLSVPMLDSKFFEGDGDFDEGHAVGVADLLLGGVHGAGGVGDIRFAVAEALEAGAGADRGDVDVDAVGGEAEFLGPGLGDGEDRAGSGDLDRAAQPRRLRLLLGLGLRRLLRLSRLPRLSGAGSGLLVGTSAGRGDQRHGGDEEPERQPAVASEQPALRRGGSCSFQEFLP